MVVPAAGERFLDLAAGTGAFSRALHAAQPAVRIVAADFCVPILRRMPAGVAHRIGSDALRIPFPAGAFDGFVGAFGVRNFADPARALAELRRVLRPSGRGLILEFMRPERSWFGAAYRLYLGLWVPFLGGLCSGSFGAYRHLTRTVRSFFTRDEFVSLLAGAGFSVVARREMTAGAATAFLVQKDS